MTNAIRLLLAVAGVGVLLWVSGPQPTAEAAPAYTVSGPYTHDNLSVFLLHGPDTLPPRPVKALDEALADGTAVVHETGNVNQLCVENLSADNDLMMQNGDILKGGKQDRVLQVAMILPPKSGPVAVPAFCVEQSRWTRRGQEAVDKFAANPGQIAGKELKLAVNAAGVQGEVWKNVAAQQMALSDKVGKTVNGAASPTSLQLALEDKELQAKLAGYRGALANALAGKQRVIGYAVAVNGKVTGAEVFGSGVLLAKAWPKAISAAAVEALSEKQAGKTFAAANEDTVQVFLADAGRQETGRNHQTEQDTSIEVTREVSITLSAPRVTANPMGGPVADSQVIQDEVTTLGSPSANVINVGQRLDLPGLGAAGNGGRGVTVANPTFTGRTASTRTRMVTGQGGRAREELEEGLPAIRFETPTVTDGRQARPAVQAPPVNVNRTAGKNGVLVESRDRANPGVVIHRTFIAK